MTYGNRKHSNLAFNRHIPNAGTIPAIYDILWFLKWAMVQLDLSI